MGELLLMAIGTYLGILFCVYVVSSAFELGGVFALILLAVAIFIGCAIGASSDDGNNKKK